MTVYLYWHDRVLKTYNFAHGEPVRVGAKTDCDIQLEMLPPYFETQTLGSEALELPYDLRLQRGPDVHTAKPLRASLTSLTDDQKLSILLSILLSAWLFVSMQGVSSKVAAKEEDKVISRVKIIFDKPVVQATPIPLAPTPRLHKPIGRPSTQPAFLQAFQSQKHNNDLLQFADKYGGVSANSPIARPNGSELGTKDISFNKDSVGKEAGNIVTPGKNGVASAMGNIDKEEVRKVIRANRSIIRACYEKHLARNSDLYGRILFKWLITKGGKVSAPRAIENDMQNEGVAKCIVNKLKNWQFPEPPEGKSTEITYPFIFSSH
jgi:hypothetical protein